MYVCFPPTPIYSLISLSPHHTLSPTTLSCAFSQIMSLIPSAHAPLYDDVTGCCNHSTWTRISSVHLLLTASHYSSALQGQGREMKKKKNLESKYVSHYSFHLYKKKPCSKNKTKQNRKNTRKGGKWRHRIVGIYISLYLHSTITKEHLGLRLCCSSSIMQSLGAYLVLHSTTGTL